MERVTVNRANIGLDLDMATVSQPITRTSFKNCDTAVRAYETDAVIDSSDIGGATWGVLNQSPSTHCVAAAGNWWNAVNGPSGNPPVAGCEPDTASGSGSPISDAVVFDAWLDPEKAGKFLYATEEGEMVRVEIDPGVGGRYAIVERRDGQDVEHTGEYLEIDRPRRLVFTLQVPLYSEEADRVTVEVAPADGGCELTLIHETSPQWADQTAEGWKMILESLTSVLS